MSEKCEKNCKISNVKDEIKADIKKLKGNDYTEEEIHEFITLCYTLKKLEKAQLNSADKLLEEFKNYIDLEINETFYKKYQTDEYSPPVNIEIETDAKYKTKQYGNVIETEFEDYKEIAEKEFNVIAPCSVENAYLTNEFTHEGKLLTTCKKKTDA